MNLIYLVLAVMAIILIDTSFSRISDLSFELLSSKFWIVFYIIILICALSIQSVLLLYVRSRSKNIGIDNYLSFRMIKYVVFFSQVPLIVIASYVIFQILFNSYYM